MAVSVLVTDPLHPAFRRLAGCCGVEVVERLGLSHEELVEMAPRFDALVVRSRTKVTREVVEAGARGRLRVIVRAGVGLDNIDLEAAREHEVAVVNVPTASSESVAELAVGLLIAAARGIAWLNHYVRTGSWGKERGREVYGKRLLVVGFGRIGRRVAALAKALGMRVSAYDVVDISEAARAMGVEPEQDLCTALSRADAVSIHVPLTPATYHMFSDELLSCLKPGAILVNTSRGAVVDAEALLRAVEEGRVYAAALDVLEHEPPRTEAERRLVQHPRVIVTPHIGASTEEAQHRIAVLALHKLLERLGHRCPEAEDEAGRVCQQLSEMGLGC